jgi:lactate dehydrogenase-like 2-hydroxyacid dehydrogenase
MAEIVIPHVAWENRGARRRIIDQVVSNIEAFLRREVRNSVTPSR